MFLPQDCVESSATRLAVVAGGCLGLHLPVSGCYLLLLGQYLLYFCVVPDRRSIGGCRGPASAGCSMFLRLVNLKARQQLQSLDIDGLQPLQQLCRDIFTQHRTLTSCSADNSDPNHQQANSGHQHIMTTGQRFVTLQQQQAIRKHQQQQPESACCSGHVAAHSTHPSPSSSTSECLHMDRPSSTCGSTKSAKRKAAEALLAARYTSSGTATQTAGSLAVACPPVVHSSSTNLSWAAAATAVPIKPDQVHSKRRRSTLSGAINRLQGADGTVTAAAGPSATAAGAAAAVSGGFRPKQQQLERLQSVLTRLQDQHQQHGLQQQQRPQDQRQQQQPGQTAGAATAQQRQRQQQQPRHGQSLQLPPLQPPLQQHVQVPACGSDCKHSSEHGWCHTQVKVPHVDWSRVLDADLNNTPSFKIAAGYERLQLPEGLQVLIVENVAHLASALQQLRASMHDPYVAIDLEWRPEFGRRFTPVALMQLATSRVAVLVRTCRMHHRLPPALKEFLKDPKVHLVGFSWSSSDEPKMQSTFGVGFKDFGRFMDLQLVAQGLGYNGFGLARLTKRVLGLTMPKSKSVTMSNWEAAVMSKNQVKYAALDVLVAGQVFRALRLWHSSPSLCEVCHYNLGSTGNTPSVYSCSCGKAYKDLRAYIQHCERSDHKPQYAECSGCGCARPLPWPGKGDGVGVGEKANTGSAPGRSDGEVEEQVQ